MLKRIVISSILVILASCVSADPPRKSMDTQSQSVLLGDTTVTLEVITRGRGPVFVAPHENEVTAIEGAKQLIGRMGGTLVILRHQGTRNVKFVLEGQTHQFDPNRIFTDEGIRRTLDGSQSEAAVTAVRTLAKAIVSHIGSRQVIALHNNTNGNYSVLSYQPGSEYADDALAVYINSELDPDDFFFITDRSLFDAMQIAGFNAVLQSPTATNDGSLSVYAAKQGIPYVNVEAEQGHLAEQLRMLEWLDQHWH